VDTRAGGGRWSSVSDPYLVPVAGIVALTLGISLFLHLKVPWGPLTPLLLLILGGGLLVNSLVSLTVREDPPEVKGAPTAGITAESNPDPPALVGRRIDSGSTQAARRSHESHRSGSTPTAGSADVVRGPPGDLLWGSWAHPMRKLPVELVGPVPETAYVPSAAEGPHLYEEGEPIFIELAKGGVRGPESYVALLDGGDFPPSPSLTNSFARESDSFARVRIRDVGSPTTTVGGTSISGGTMRKGEASENPTPLRSPMTTHSGPSSVGTVRPALHGSGRTVRCADCQQILGELKNPRRCLACLRRLCSDCAASCLRTLEGVWCHRCAEAKHMDGLSSEFARRAHPILDPALHPDSSAGASETAS